MTLRFTRHAAGFRGGALLAVALTLVPLPLLAADTAAAPPQPLKTSIAKHAKHDVLAPAPRQAARASTHSTASQPSNNPHESGFFRSPAGIACLAVIAAGTGYAVYSASHDRIHSVARQNQ